MKALLPFLKLYKRYIWRMSLGMLLALVTLSASIFLLTLSGWFLAAAAFIGFAGLYTFNYMLPAAGVRGAAIMRTAARYAERLVSHDTTFRLLSFLRTLAFKKILPLSPGQLQAYQKADLLNRFIADIDHLDHFYLKLLSPVITALLTTLVIFLSLSYFNTPLAIVIALILLMTILVIPVIFYQAGKQLGEHLIQQKSHYREQLVIYLQGQSELAIFNAQTHFRKQLDQMELQWLSSQQKQATLASIAQALILFIVGLMTVLVLWLVADGVPNYSAPLIALFVFICLSTAEILAPIPNAFIYLGQVIASAKRISQIFDQQPDIQFPLQGQTIPNTPITLTFNQVSFHYSENIQSVLDKVSFTIEPGQHVALIGKTGCGKSTLLKLITRAWDPQQGDIQVNGISLSQFDEATLRNMMAVVPQTIDIFSSSLRDNLLVANPQATDEQLIAALEQVDLSKLLQTESGLDLWLGDSGRPLSGGEKRRIGIARALLHDASLILMDEPTESLDINTEQQIIALIKQVYQNKTVLMVTHRLANNMMFDKTYLLENGHLSPFHFKLHTN